MARWPLLRIDLACLIVLTMTTYGPQRGPVSAAGIVVKPSVRLGRGSITGIAVSPDQKTLAVNGSEGLWLYNLATLGKIPRLLTQPPPVRVSLLPARELIAAAKDPAERAWDVPPD